MKDALERFDAASDSLLDAVRDRPGVEFVAAVLSNLSDYGFVWALLAAGKARRAGPARRRAVRALALSGALSFGANALVKELVRRPRPRGTDAQRRTLVPVRPPTTSSFPSGHTLAAFCTAALLADGPGGVIAGLGFAALVAGSRVLLRAHHASDVVAGALIGTALGLTARVLLSSLVDEDRPLDGGRFGRRANPAREARESLSAARG